jgi:lipid A 3-O-deacylase
MRHKLLLFICLFGTLTCFAQTHRDEFGIQSDNDSYLFTGSDKYYTDGLFFYLRHALPVKSKDTASLRNKILGFELGQKIFNPQSGAIPSPIYIDRPFAGYLYAASSLNLLYKDESNLKLTAQLGVVGPASLGEKAQNFVHDNFGFYHTAGWQYQIKNDAELNLSAEYNRLLARADGVDISVSSYANLGNGFTGAGVGPLIRLGNFNQLFNSESTQSTAIVSRTTAPLHAKEFFFYYKPQINYVAYDATIQGSLFGSHNASDLEVTGHIEPVIFSQQFGVVYDTSRWTFNVFATFHTRDTKEMVQSHQWGSVLVLYHFN